MTDAEPSRAQRVRRALAGAPVDRPPISFWAHNFARENSAEALAAETLRQFRRHGWDFIKIQSRASCFAEGWGNRYRVSTERATPPELLDHALRAGDGADVPRG